MAPKCTITAVLTTSITGLKTNQAVLKGDKKKIRFTVFAEINAHQKQWFFKGGSTQNRWALMGDFSKGRVHKTDGNGWFFKGGSFWWMILQRGEYTKPMGFGMFFLLLKIKRTGRLFRQRRYVFVACLHYAILLRVKIRFSIRRDMF